CAESGYGPGGGAWGRAPYMGAWRSKKLQGALVAVSAAPGNAASRLEAFVVSTGPYAYGGHPDIDDLFHRQAQERDRKKREAMLYEIQRLMHDRVMHGPIFEPATLHGVGPRVEEPAVGLNPLLYFTAPHEDIRLKKPWGGGRATERRRSPRMAPASPFRESPRTRASDPSRRPLRSHRSAWRSRERHRRARYRGGDAPGRCRGRRRSEPGVAGACRRPR